VEPAFIEKIQKRIGRLDPLGTPKALLVAELTSCLEDVSRHHLATCKRDNGPDCVIASMLILTLQNLLNATMALKKDHHYPSCPLYKKEEQPS
jgi:hypothetical protein